MRTGLISSVRACYQFCAAKAVPSVIEAAIENLAPRSRKCAKRTALARRIEQSRFQRFGVPVRFRPYVPTRLLVGSDR
jgi:hypothetical protein